MTTVTFPPDLPRPLISNYSFAPFRSFRRIEVSDGPPRYRLNSPNYTSIVGVEWRWSESEFQDFRLWYENFAELNFNRWFRINLAVGLADPSTGARLLQSLEAHFFEDWSATLDPASDEWLIVAQLETRYQSPGGILDPQIFDAKRITETAPVDINDARSITEEAPSDIIDSATPSFWR